VPQLGNLSEAVKAMGSVRRIPDGYCRLQSRLPIRRSSGGLAQRRPPDWFPIAGPLQVTENNNEYLRLIIVENALCFTHLGGKVFQCFTKYLLFIGVYSTFEPTRVAVCRQDTENHFASLALSAGRSVANYSLIKRAREMPSHSLLGERLASKRRPNSVLLRHNL